jgi:murein DD-endopeptidase MepM/ murein hydrolase activator NlpD
VSEWKRHAPVTHRRRPIGGGGGRRSGEHALLGNIQRRRGDIFSDDLTDRAVTRSGFRWLLSTCLAAAVGALSVVVVVVGSNDSVDRASNTRFLPRIDELRGTAERRIETGAPGLRWALPKSDRMQTMAGTMSARFIIHDSMKVRDKNRERIVNRAYTRVVARLAPIPAADADKIPAFNPYKLYATPGEGSSEVGTDDTQDVAVRLLDLATGELPFDDGQEMDAQEVADVVLRSLANSDEAAPTSIRGGYQIDGADRLSAGALLAERSARSANQEALAPNTTALKKASGDAEETDDLEAREVRVVKVGRGQTLTRILTDLGGDRIQIRAMVRAAEPMVADNGLLPGQEVHITLVPSLTRAAKLEPARVSIFGEGHEHKVTVARNAAGEFVSSASPLDERIARAAMGTEDTAQNASMYASFYHTALSHGLATETIDQILRIHAYETDFRRRVRGGDQIEWFFDTREDDRPGEGGLGELLMTSITTSGETQKFYRYRTPDGIVDFYDESGTNSRKFLMRRPVRGDATRLSSGFGLRRHPILGIVRPHNGVDWSAPSGTPIMAAGQGVIEEAGYKGEHGNYIRIAHANGYKTSYSHMSRYAAGVSQGVRVRQGQVIGFIGNTGLSSAPHLHFEVLVNNRHVDPMSIQVPRERRLAGNQLRDFLKERTRIDDLLRRNPVSSRIMEQAALR